MHKLAGIYIPEGFIKTDTHNLDVEGHGEKSFIIPSCQ